MAFFKYKTENTYWKHNEKIKELCRNQFGPQHKQVRKIDLSVKDNHGNWDFGRDGKVSFRYEKDYMWFLLQTGHLADKKTVYPWWSPAGLDSGTGSTGPK